MGSITDVGGKKNGTGSILDITGPHLPSGDGRVGEHSGPGTTGTGGSITGIGGALTGVPATILNVGGGSNIQKNGDGATHPAGPTMSAAAAHHALISIGILLAFVIVSTILAGANPALGHGIVALMLVMLLMQGITHVNPITEWVNNHQFTA